MLIHSLKGFVGDLPKEWFSQKQLELLFYWTQFSSENVPHSKRAYNIFAIVSNFDMSCNSLWNGLIDLSLFGNVVLNGKKNWG